MNVHSKTYKFFVAFRLFIALKSGMEMKLQCQTKGVFVMTTDFPFAMKSYIYSHKVFKELRHNCFKNDHISNSKYIS